VRGASRCRTGRVRLLPQHSTRERIVIEGPLRYADDPRVSLAADDYLGLVSDKFVEVARPAVTGPGDLQVDAAIYARRGAGRTRVYRCHANSRIDCGTRLSSGLRYCAPSRSGTNV
jgi:hypothetical protein